jgi:hypothetical protein
MGQLLAWRRHLRPRQRELLESSVRLWNQHQGSPYDMGDRADSSFAFVDYMQEGGPGRSPRSINDMSRTLRAEEMSEMVPGMTLEEARGYVDQDR